MLSLKFGNVRGRLFKANLPESEYFDRYNLSIAHKNKQGDYEYESWLVEMPKGPDLDRKRIEIAVEDMAINNGYNANDKKQYAPSIRVYNYTVIEDASAVKVDDDDLPF